MELFFRNSNKWKMIYAREKGKENFVEKKKTASFTTLYYCVILFYLFFFCYILFARFPSSIET